jgi:hypothetical protein
MAYASKKNNMFNTPEVEVKWASVGTPDDYAGALSHQCVVWLTPELKAQILELAGADAHINGMGKQAGTDREFIKFKTTAFTREGKERMDRVYDAQGQLTEANPMGGDTVKVRVSGPVPARNRPDAVSFYLSAVQIIAKQERDLSGGSPFDAVEGGFTSEAPTTEADVQPESDDNIPF